MKTLIFCVLLISANAWAKDPAPLVHNTVSDKDIRDAKEIILNITEKMPVWDEDKPGQFERELIEVVKIDIQVCAFDDNVPNFMDDYGSLLNDFQALVALDDALKVEHVI